MQILLFAFYHTVLLILYGIFGMTLLPDAVRRRGNRNTFFLISPMIGAAVWLSLTVGFGLMLPYNAAYLTAMLLLAAIWVVFHRKTFFLPENPGIWFAIPAIIAGATMVSRFIAPTEINGGLYFPQSIYDHIKCAIVNSISAHGLPPVNPWLAENGSPLTLVYYFGWHAWTAQLPILMGCDAFFAECVMTGFTSAIAMMGIVGLLVLYGARKTGWGIALLLTLTIFDIGWEDFAAMHLPKSWMVMFTTKELSGFWHLFSNFIWSPQHIFGALSVIMVLIFHGILLKSEKRRTSAACSILLGLSAAAAVFTSVYAGIFALIEIAVLMVFDYLRQKEFRSNFNRSLGWQALAVILALALTALYLKYLFSYPPEKNPIGFGMMPCFGKIKFWWQYPLFFLQFYLLILPMRIGTNYVLGIIALFVPGILPKNPLMDFCRKYVIASLLVIFFVHSTFYSNDFGWRTITATQLIFTVFAVFTLLEFFRKIKKRSFAVFSGALFAAVFFFIGIWSNVRNLSVVKYDAPIHRAFARAVPGWKVVRAHSRKDDLVLCNPAGFYEIGKLYLGEQSTNVFFSLYAKRDTPIADLIFSKCYSEFFPQKKVEERYEKVVAVFAGNPSKSDADYLADDLKTCALLVTPLDGLWQNPGEIESRFPMKEETADYRVYWRED